MIYRMTATEKKVKKKHDLSFLILFCETCIKLYGSF